MKLACVHMCACASVHVLVRACACVHAQPKKNLTTKFYFDQRNFFHQKPQKNFLTKFFFSPKNYWTKKKFV